MPQGTVLKALQESEHRKMSRWMSALPSLPQTDAASIQACTIGALEHCAMGWTIIIQPALTLAVELLDGAAKKSGGFSASLLGRFLHAHLSLGCRQQPLLRSVFGNVWNAL